MPLLFSSSSSSLANLFNIFPDAYIHNFNGQMTCDWKERARFSDCPKEDSFYPNY